MTSEEKQKFRKEALNLHYELSEGNSWNLVMRTKVAEKLGLNNYNDNELLGTIKYLEDKGFLKAQTNIEDQITDIGIDEVEKEFPNFPEESKEESVIEDEVAEELFKLLKEIEGCYKKGEEVILKREKLDEVVNLIRTKLQEVIPKLNNEELSLKFEKLYSGLHFILKPGFHDKQTAIGKLGKQEEFIKQVLERILGETPRPEVFISSGQPYEGRKTLRLILHQAKQKIWLVDSYMHPETLIILEPYLAENQNLEVRLLTCQKNNSNFKSFKSDLLTFKNQYKQLNFESRENDKCHGRFFIVDDKIYNSGHSIHDLGKRADAINLMQNEKEKNKFWTDFNDWWNTGNIV